MAEKQKYPGPVYAAAGFGDLAAEKLRELPDRVSGLQTWAREELAGGREKAQADLADLGGRIGSGLAGWRARVQDLAATDRARLRVDARRKAGELADEAGRRLVTAQVRAAEAYQGLVTRGSTVLGEPAPSEPAGELPEQPAAEPEPAAKAEAGPAAKPEGEKAKPEAGKAKPAAGAKKMAKKATRPAVRKTGE